jgi:bifunctional non-homologous end joining protein LigD
MARKHSDRHAALPEAVEPMLATPDGGELRDNPRYVYEWKWDGYRAIMRLASDGTVALTSRNGNDFTARYPELSGPIGDAFGGKPVVLDGEIVALNEQGRPDFGLLQNRRKAGRSVSYFAFDVLRVGEESFLDEPYSRRREVLTAIDPSDEKVITVPPAYSRSRLAASDLTPAGLLDIAAESGLEGLVYKAANSRYRPGHRSPDWLKRPLIQTREVVIGGWRPGQGRRGGTLGALLLGAHDPDTGNLRYIGDVGTGFSEDALRDLLAQLTALKRRNNPFANEVPRDRARDARWVSPSISNA